MKTTGYRKIPAKDPKRVYQGTANKAMGNALEIVIDAALDYYARRGVAVIEKTPEPMKPVKDLGGGKFVAHYEKKAQPDYKGVLKGGQSVIFEAKHTTADRIEQSRVTDAQGAALDQYAAMGAECFIVVGFNMREFYKIPWELFRDMKSEFGRKYATAADLEQYRIKLGGYAQLLILG